VFGGRWQICEQQGFRRCRSITNDIPDLSYIGWNNRISSIREGSNKVLLEAAALGTPFVATTTSGTNEFFRDPPGGAEVPPGDTPSLSRAIVELLLDERRRRMLGQQAAQGSLRFRSDQVAEEMVGLYTEVLAGQRKR